MTSSPMRPVLAENLPMYFIPFVNHRVQRVLKDFHCLHVDEEDSLCSTKIRRSTSKVKDFSVR